MKEKYKADCFGYHIDGRGKSRCGVLTTPIDCMKCAFYKSKAQAIDENLKCKERLANLHIKYTSMFSEKEIADRLEQKIKDEARVSKM